MTTFSRARSPLARLADSVSQQARARRLQLLRSVLTSDTTIVDIACGEAGLISIAPDLDVVGVDIQERPGYPGRFVQADATDRLPFSDGAFDLAYSNSVIEHLPPDRWTRFASELKRVARGWFVQTPAFEFPLEPHAFLPFAHWLPMAVRRPYWRLGAGSDVEKIQLLRRREIEALFGPAIPERAGPLGAWVAIGSRRG
ncbi:MAG TPA: class I SAM-dependent methyltransferase [Solirubrobacteraceae bacterium]|nr:class I SAM-dependent methyltransferase [Solirubrobacteraceae bacterium]